MVAGVKIPFAFLSGSLSVILKVQTNETQLKINKKRKLFLLLASLTSLLHDIAM